MENILSLNEYANYVWKEVSRKLPYRFCTEGDYEKIEKGFKILRDPAYIANIIIQN